jgi:hypothetical protein
MLGGAAGLGMTFLPASALWSRTGGSFVQPWTLTAALHPSARWAGIAHTHAVSMGPVTVVHKGMAAGVLLTLADPESMTSEPRACVVRGSTSLRFKSSFVAAPPCNNASLAVQGLLV